MTPDASYSLTELADLAGVTTRTVRYYIEQGLLPSVGPSGPGSKYDDRHLARLRLIRRLQAEHLPLAEIRRRLDDLEEDEIRELAAIDPPAPPSDSAIDYIRAVLAEPSTTDRPASASLLRRVAEPAPRFASVAPPMASASASPAGVAPASPAREAAPVPSEPIERSQWERVVLAPDIELHIRRPLVRAQQKQVDRLVTIARELLKEERP